MSLDSTAHCAETAPSLVKFKGSEGAWWGSQAGRGKLRASRWPQVQGHGHHLADLASSLWCQGQQCGPTWKPAAGLWTGVSSWGSQGEKLLKAGWSLSMPVAPAGRARAPSRSPGDWQAQTTPKGSRGQALGVPGATPERGRDKGRGEDQGLWVH